MTLPAVSTPGLVTPCRARQHARGSAQIAAGAGSGGRR
jgi:hypothetical protein